jgi:hypothetical protein
MLDAVPDGGAGGTMSEHLHTVAQTISVDALAETVWRHVTDVDIAAFRHPAYLALLGIPRPLRADVTTAGVGGARVAYFASGRRFSQRITAWQPPTYYAFTFHADPGFRVGYVLDLGDGPFQMKAGAYRIVRRHTSVRLTLVSRYVLRGWIGAGLWLPTRLVLLGFQRSLLAGIKASAERDGT